LLNNLFYLPKRRQKKKKVVEKPGRTSPVKEVAISKKDAMQELDNNA
jgi:hypothetical protein